MLPSSLSHDQYASEKMFFYFQVLNSILNDDVDMIQKIYTSVNNSYQRTFLFCAARNGKLKSLHWLWHFQPLDDPLLPVESVSSQSKECLLFLHKSGCHLDKNVTYTSSYLGNLECLQYAIQNECEYCIEDVITGLNKHYKKINLGDWWWRNFIFDQLYPNLVMLSCKNNQFESFKIMIEKYKCWLEQIQTIVVNIFSSNDNNGDKWIPKDVIQYILLTYI